MAKASGKRNNATPVRIIIIAVFILVVGVALLEVYKSSSGTGTRCTQNSECPTGQVCAGIGPMQPSSEIPGVCLSPKQAESIAGGTVYPSPITTANATFEITGTVRYSDIEGGCWYIDANQECAGDKCPLSFLPSYEPVNLPAALKKDGTKARFTLEIQQDIASICQIGPSVKILEYQVIG